MSASACSFAERLDRFLVTLRARADRADRVELCSGGAPSLDLTLADRDRVMDAFGKGIDKKP